MFPLRRVSDPPGTTVDFDAERAGCMAVLAAGAVFLVSCYYAWHEFRYLLWGQSAKAPISRTFRAQDLRRGGRTVYWLAVEYSFVDAASGQVRAERDDVDLDWPVDGDVIAVQYIPGEPGSSRLVGHRSLLSVLIVVLSLTAVAGFVYKMHRRLNSAPARHRARGNN